MMSVREFDFEVGVFGFVLLGSALLNINVGLSAARTALTIFLSGDMDFLSTELLVSLWEVGGNGETFPSDARMS